MARRIVANEGRPGDACIAVPVRRGHRHILIRRFTMKGDAATLQQLNAVLRNALTAIDQTFLHSRMLGNWGLRHLEQHEHQVSIRQMKQADLVIQRILFLEGLPNLQDLGKLLIGEDVAEILRNDLTLAGQIHAGLGAAIAHCEQTADYISREHLEHLLEAEEEWIDWLETQGGLIRDLGVQNYLQSGI
jgi:bacterioferritin